MNLCKTEIGDGFVIRIPERCLKSANFKSGMDVVIEYDDNNIILKHL